MPRGTLKPRMLADQMVKAMQAAASQIWLKEKESLDVRDPDLAKGLVWAHVQNAFIDKSGRSLKAASEE